LRFIASIANAQLTAVPAAKRARGELRLRALEARDAEDVLQLGTEHRAKALELDGHALHRIGIFAARGDRAGFAAEERGDLVALRLAFVQARPRERAAERRDVADRERDDAAIEVVADVRRRKLHRDDGKRLFAPEFVRHQRVDG
jgi:hypothetical protein